LEIWQDVAPSASEGHFNSHSSASLKSVNVQLWNTSGLPKEDSAVCFN
jgi:hypothetical protein